MSLECRFGKKLEVKSKKLLVDQVISESVIGEKMMSAEPWALSNEKGENICTDVSLNYHVALARGFEAGKVFCFG